MRNLFINNPQEIYLNSGTESKTPITVMNAIENYKHQYEMNPTSGFVTSYQKMWEMQMHIARFFNCNPQELFLRNNITEVMNQFILGSPMPSGSEILVTNLEYQAILNCVRFKAEREHLTIKVVDIPVKKDLEKSEILELVKKAISNATKMLVISHIFTGSGAVVPVKEIAEITSSRGIKLVVDGAHSPGALKVDFQVFKEVDFFGGNFHKWMMGPKGTAFGWTNPKHHDDLVPLMAGWTTFETISPFDTFGGGSQFTSKMMLLGTQNFCQFIGINDLLNFWEEHGENTIRNKILKLTQFAENLISEQTQLKSLYPKDKKLQGPLITFVLPEKLEKEGYHLMHRLYKENHLQVASTKIKGIWHLRISPHIYNTEEEIIQAATFLKKL
ncbi:MAG: aminotransferase class V-fold PLP-dependent enzyme [Bdellovibrio sp.]|nr:aminotransferase class V-fold PLP-dependent enzyme [Bdellovibrio sp.]